MKDIKQCSVLFFLFVSILANAKIGIGVITPNPAATSNLGSVNKGFLLPRMTAVARNLIIFIAIYETEIVQSK